METFYVISTNTGTSLKEYFVLIGSNPKCYLAMPKEA
jgi:hypothetical protein